MMELASKSKMIEAKRGETVTVQSTLVGHAYLVKEGHLRVLRSSPDGRAIAIDILEPGDVIGLTPIMTEDADADRAEAMDDVLFCRVPAAMLREVLEKNPTLSLHFSKRIGIRRRALETRLLGIAFCTVRVRTARLILELMDRFGEKRSDCVRIGIRLSHQEMGELIGANREAVNRAMGSLIDDGGIRFVGKTLEVVNVDALRRAADLDFAW